MAARKGTITREKLAAGPWYLRVSIDGKLRPVRIAQSRSTDAIAEAKRILTQRAEDAPNLARALDSLRPVRSTAPTIRQIVDAMMSAPISTTEHTRRGYTSGTKMFLETTLGPVPAWDTRTIDALTPELVYKYRSAVHARLVAADADDLARARAYRTGNSILRDIRALFTPQLQEHYRIAHVLEIPATIAAFREAPGFDGATKSQTQYRRPSDQLLSATLSDLMATRDTHRARFVAVWLALGFGLRKSEAAAVRVGWFREVDGHINLELRAVVKPGSTSESPMTKNGDVAPLIPCANGAWKHLGPILATMSPDDYAIPASSPTERRDGVFREISTWLAARGWETQKQYHEFRALGGCWLADATKDLYAVSRWLQHSSVTVTERAYGRYLRSSIPDVSPTMISNLPDSRRDTRPDSSASHHQTTPNDTNTVLFGAVSSATISPDAIEPQRDPLQKVEDQPQSVRSSVG
jgi:integrase